MKQKKIIIIGALLIALIVILACAAAALLQDNDTYAEKLESGYRYLQEGDFNNAILQFRYAIEEDGTREEAYFGLYQAYLHSGQTDLAAVTLRMGISSTQSSYLQELLVQLDTITTQDKSNDVQGETTSQTNELEAKDIYPVLNTDLLTIFASANYGDYCAKYGSEAGTYAGGQFTKYLESVGATLIYRDTASQRIIDTSRGVPYTEYLPNEIRLDNVLSLFGGVGSLSFDTLKSLSGVSDAARSGNTITFTYSGCEVTIQCDDAGNITANSGNSLVPSGEVEAQKQYTLTATVVDATTNNPIAGAKIKLYEGHNTFGTAIEGTTDSTGRLSLDMEVSGAYTVMIEKNGYISEQYDLIVLSNVADYQKTFLLSPVMSGEGIRFVLSWGAVPTDLDSYLVGTSGDGTNVYINYTNMSKSDMDGNLIAELDVDDTTSYGPETTTLYDTAGTYEFYVDDFTNSGMISTSSATVKIYVGSTLYATVTIPAGVSDMWHVCTIVNGEITVTNRGM